MTASTAAPATNSRVGPAFGLAVLAAAIPMFMATLDNLVVTTALPVIKSELGATLEQLQWFVNSYTLSFATLLLTAAALGDRLGRRRVFTAGIALFTLASAACALAAEPWILIIARAIQGVGAAAILPLSLTLLAAAVPVAKRAAAIGIWGGVAGLGVAVGPVVGGAIVNGAAWQWIFWLNVPVGLVAIVLANRVLRESRGPDRVLDPIGLLLAGAGVLALVWGVVRANDDGWTAPNILAALIGGVALLAAFAAWERRATAPLLPLRLFRSRAFTAANAATIAFSFGMFGSVFLLAQFFQVVQGYSPLEAGVRTMPWTMVPMVVAPLAGLVVNRVGPRVLVSSGLAFQAVALAWMAAVTTADVAYASLVPPFVLAGLGMGLTFAPVATAVLASVADREHGKASGTNNTLREIGVALGVAVLSSVFAAFGSYVPGPGFVDGLRPAVLVGAIVVAIGAVLALGLPGRPSTRPDGDVVESGAVPVLAA
ncbi:MAG: drug resistance transporter, EmrB/QacA subfamily, partial [Pseudonocardia sp.]|nr:drug resistance transporter, EmrB/QacA subfamily [Pseudonocardia sp.]